MLTMSPPAHYPACCMPGWVHGGAWRGVCGAGGRQLPTQTATRYHHGAAVLAVLLVMLTRSPNLIYFSRRLNNVWFLLQRGQVHQSHTTLASALLSTGVLPLR